MGCEEEFFPLAVYIMLASYVAGASLKATWETTDILCSQTMCPAFQFWCCYVMLRSTCVLTLSPFLARDGSLPQRARYRCATVN
jgi:hypothetical protein